MCNWKRMVFISFPSRTKILNNPEINITCGTIPDDLLEGISKEDYTDFLKIQLHDLHNSSMFRDGSINSMIFQQNIYPNSIRRSKRNAAILSNLYPAITETFSKPVSKPKILTEVPTISYLMKQVESCMKSSNQSLKINKTLPWNTLFHKILDDYDLKGSFTPQTLPGSYTKGQNCGYISHVDLADSTTKFLYLTTLENAKNPDLSVPNEILCKFIYSVTFCNPVWDIGLQHKLASKNLNRDYNLQLQHIQNYNTNCVCPCS